MPAALTVAQYTRLDQMPEGARVVGMDRDCPLVEYKGRIQRIDPKGRAVPVTGEALDRLAERRVENQEDGTEGLEWGPWPS